MLLNRCEERGSFDHFAVHFPILKRSPLWVTTIMSEKIWTTFAKEIVRKPVAPLIPQPRLKPICSWIVFKDGQQLSQMVRDASSAAN